ncbi:hypothetical protein B0A52_08524 [Exophiala mesophila]|uniref:Uncharacterized protein n=1 Tax=Exophiala mesophila TaxID=212818 RepID=A0A438MXS4_EXOME|nr:hypothetical protein B0A52_08524 [Exophiala mesophila]
MASSNDGRFTFIPVDWRCKPAQEAIRVHIMRQRHRQARRDPKTPRVMRHERSSGEEIHFWNSSDEYSGRSKDCESRADRLSASRECPRLPHSDIGQSPGDEYRSLLLSPSASSPELSETSDSVIYPPLSSPLDVEEILVRHYLQYAGGSQITHQLLRVYRDTAGTFSAFLAIIAANYADENDAKPLLSIAEMENKALKEVSAQLSQSPTVPACSTMMTVAMLASLSECLSQSDLVESHWRALQRMVDINGGINRLRMHQDLYSFLLLIEAVVLSTISGSIVQPYTVSIYVDVMNQELQDFLSKIHQRFVTSVKTNDDFSPRITDPILTRAFRPR